MEKYPSFIDFTEDDNTEENLAAYNQATNYTKPSGYIDFTVDDDTELPQSPLASKPAGYIDFTTDDGKPAPTVISEIAKAGVKGVADLVGDVGSITSDLGITEKPLWERPETRLGDPETMAGKIGAELVGFLIPYTGFAKGITWAAKLAKGANYVMGKRAQVAKYAGASALSSFVTFSPDDKNISAIVQEYPALQNPITEFLATDHKDPEALNRLKAAIEDIGVGFAFEGIIKGLGMGLKATDMGITKMMPKVDPTAYPDDPEAMIKVLVDMKKAEAVSLTGDVKYAANTVVQNTFDKLNRVKHIEELARKVYPEKYGDDIVTTGAYEDGRLAASTGDQIYGFFKHGPFQITPEGEVVRTLDYGLQSIVDEVQKVGAVEDWKAYLKYSRANHMERNGIRSGIKRDETLTELLRIESTPYFSTIVEQTERLKVLNDKTLDMFPNVVNTEKKSRLLTISPIYAPFYRTMPDKGGIFKRTRGRLNLSKNPTGKNRKDFNAMSEKDYNEWLDTAPPIDDILSNIQRSYSALIEYGIKNTFKDKLYTMTDDLGDLGKLFAKKLEGADKDTAVTLISKDNLKAVLKREGMKDFSELDQLDEDLFKVYSKQIPQNKEIDMVWRNGEAFYYRVEDELLYDSLASMGPRVMSDFAKKAIPIAGSMKNFFTRMVTMNPEFAMGTNLIKDTVQMSIFSRTNFKPGWHTAKGVWQNNLDKKGYDNYLYSGGGMGSHIHGESRADIGNYEKHLALYGINVKSPNTTLVAGSAKAVNKASRDALNLADRFLFRFEHGGRRQEFERLREQGYSSRKAAYQAREIGSDFGNRGSSHYVQNIAAMVPFFNASLQGLYRYGRAIDPTVIYKARLARRNNLSYEKVGLTKNQVDEVERIYARIGYRIVLPSVALHYMYTSGLTDEVFGNQDLSNYYKSLPDYVKKTNWVIVLPGVDGKPHAFYIPKPFDVGAIGTLATKVMDEWGNESEKNILAKYLWEGMTSVLRMGDGASWAPQIVRGPVEIAMNERFTGAPVVPPELANLTGQASIGQDTPYTSSSARTAANWALSANRAGVPMPDFAMSPMKLEHLVNSFFGTIGYLVREYGFDPFLEDTEPPDRKMSDMPYLRRFYEQSPLPVTQQGLDLYDRAEKVKSMHEAHEIFKKGIDSYSQKQFKEFVKDPDFKFYQSQYPQMTKAVEQLSKLNTAIEQVTKSNRDGASKLEALDRLRQAKNEITRRLDETFVAQYKANKEQKEAQ